MSGHKRATITITRDEYERLRESRQNFRAIPEIPPPVVENISQRRSAAIENSVLELEQRHAEFQDILNGLNQNIRQIEQTNADSLFALQTNTYRQVQQHSGQMLDRVEKLIDEQTKRFNATIAANQSKNQEALHQLSSEMDHIAKSEGRKQSAAKGWLEDNVRFFNFVNENYACEFFLPGQMEKLSWQIDTVSQNIENGSYEAALSISQKIHFNLSDMRLQLEKLHSAWQIMFIDTWETTLQILTQAEESIDIPAIDLHGEILPYSIHVDTWVENRLSNLIQEISEFRDLLEEQGSTFSLETLRDYREHSLPGFMRQLEDIITTARVNAINAQLRINIADFVIQALREQGFAPSQAGYETNDAQSPYQVVFTNYEGSEVIVQVNGAGEKVGQNELHLKSMDKQIRSEDELENRWYAISHSLEQVGLSVGDYIREDRPSYTVPNQRPQNRGRGYQQNKQTGRAFGNNGN